MKSLTLQVPTKARRRRHSTKYKAEILAEYENADREGRGALLRRYGLYTSLIKCLAGSAVSVVPVKRWGVLGARHQPRLCVINFK